MFEISPPFHGLGRREFLRDAGLAAVPFLLGGQLRADTTTPDGLIERERNPDNFEFPFQTLNSFITPNERFYVRNHFAAPMLDAAKWTLQVVGAVERPLKLSYADVLALPSARLPVTLECAGNGRAYLLPKTKGVQWVAGAVSTAEWTGVTLAAVLEKAGVKPGAVEVILEGSDSGEPKEEPKPVGVFSFVRSLPIQKARRPEVLLAYKMNDKPLPHLHGYPLRAVVGGWYGMASVKWLRRIVVTERPYRGYWQTTGYTTWQKRAGLPTQVPITDVQVKASIARPTAGEVLPAGKAARVHGAAWAGEAQVAKVEVSTDGGTNWAPAKLLGDEVPFCWRLWEYTWTAPVAGKHDLMVRATDSRGRVQPLKHDPDERNYLINHSVRTEVTVR